MSKKIIAIGNAIVDSIIKSDDEFIAKLGVEKGTMALLTPEQAELLSNQKTEKTTSGGSAGNTIAALAQLRNQTSFIGKVGNDIYGREFISEIEKTGCKFLSSGFDDGMSARSMILVSPDGQRTMVTFLGCASNISEDDIKEEYFADAEIFYIEGYLWDAAPTISAIKKAIKLAKKSGTKIAFTISDSFCVARHKQEFIELIQNDVDILFANEAEAAALVDTSSNWQELNVAWQKFIPQNVISVVTRSSDGCAVFYENKIVEVKTDAVKAIDSTGAGDAFAAGFIHGIVNKFSFEDSAKLANKLGGKIVQKIGARFENSEIKSIAN